jgi:DNA-directed RNA polymerase specialized sigma subunit
MLRYAEELEFDEIAGVLKIAKAEVEEIHKLIVGRLKNTLTPCDALAGV